MATRTLSVYDELLDFLAGEVSSSHLRRFRPSVSTQSRVERLLKKNRDGKLTPGEARELDDYEVLEHIVRMLKSRVKTK